MPDPVAAYIQAAPEAQRPALRELRQMIRAAHPDALEQMGPNGFAVYTRDGQWIAGFATRRKCPMLYVMAPRVLDAFAEALGKLRTGKSCVEYREGREMSMDRLRELARQMLAYRVETPDARK